MPNFPIVAKACINIDESTKGIIIMDTPPNIMNADMLVVRLKYCKEKNIITYVGISMKPLLKIDTEYIVHLVMKGYLK